MIDLSIIIVNWNSKNYLERCIASILNTTHNINYEIIVIDNASFDGCDRMLGENYPQVRFIQSNQNLGFARANNEGFKVSHGRNLLFLNPDTEAQENAIQALLRQLNIVPNAGAVGARLLNSDNSIQTSCIQAFPTILNQLLDAEVLRKRFPRSRLWGMTAIFDSSQAPKEVDAVSGACLMIKRAVFENVVMFSTEYFMYSEDIDLCFKVWKAGWKIHYIPASMVVHHGGASSSQTGASTLSNVMMLESRWRFFRKTRCIWYCWSYRLGICSACLIRIGLVLAIWPVLRPSGKKAELRAIVKKWSSRLCWALGGGVWSKNIKAIFKSR